MSATENLVWEQVVVDAKDPEALARWWANLLGWVVVGADPGEFEIRPSPDRLPGLLFGPVPEPKTLKNQSTSIRRTDRDAEVERLLSASGAGPVPMSARARRRGWCSPTPRATSSAFSAPGSGESRGPPWSPTGVFN